MQSLILVWGRNPELSILEAASLFQAEKTQFEIKALTPQAELLEIQENAKPGQIVKNLGGTVKIAKVLFQTQSNDFEALRKALEGIDFSADFGRKFYYTINDYSKERNEESTQAILEHLKQSFKSQKLKAMLKWPKKVKGKQKTSVSPKTLSKRLQKEHLDLCILESQGKLYFAKTIAVSNPKEFAERDTGRPTVKPELVTSVRLARILVNLAGLEKGKTILDCFCGIGSIMQEALLTGHNAIGLDSSKENAKDCEKNLLWAKKKYSVFSSFKVFNADSKKLSEALRNERIDAVVSEPFMGPFLKRLPSTARASQIIQELSRLYASVFSELAKTLKPGSKAVFILPQIPTIEGRKIRVQESVFKTAGFKVFNPLQAQAPNAVPFLYKDAENRIERWIYVLVKEQ